MDRYDNCIFAADFALGALRRGLDRLDSGRNTLLLVVGDHGEAFGEHLGDSLHGNYLYDESVRVPCLLHSTAAFLSREDLHERFQMKDLPETLLFLLGLHSPGGFRQSHNIFSKARDDKIYLTNVYQDYKLGMVTGEEKVVYRPQRNLMSLFDLAADPSESHNVIGRLERAETARRRRELIQWYYHQIEYLEREFPLR